MPAPSSERVGAGPAPAGPIPPPGPRSYDLVVSQRGFGLVEILIVLAGVAVAGYVVMQYVGSTAKTVETLQQDRPIDRTRLAADRATLTAMQGLVRTYQAERGQCRPTKPPWSGS